MTIVRESEEVTRAAAELNAHVAALDQESDTAHIINEVFYHMNQINEETEKVILLNHILREKMGSRINLLSDGCKNLLVKFYEALLNKVHQEILDGLIKNDHNGLLPTEPDLSQERIIKENLLKEKIINPVADYKVPLSLEKKIIMLEAIKQKQENFFKEIRANGSNTNDVITSSLERLNQLLEDCYFLYEAQRKRSQNGNFNSQGLVTTADEKMKTNVLANEKESSFFQHINTLHSTIGEEHPRTQRLLAIKENMNNTKNPVIRALILGDVLEEEINSGKSLLKPDLLIMKQYRDAILKLASLQLMDDLIGEERLSKLQEPWLSIERNQVVDRILHHFDDFDVDPCKEITFPSALSPLQHEQMKLVLLQGIKLLYQTSNNQQDLPHNNFNLDNPSDVARLIQCLETWESKYKTRLRNENLPAEQKQEAQQQVASSQNSKPESKRRWKILDFFTKKK